jgi:hypothetical protein|tara:strand:- start:13823 stop:13999 length:177 start_codon:yes stop_codon:yes gene_type:complete
MSTPPSTTQTVPLHEQAFDEILALVPRMLNDDEAGPAFFIIDAEWAVRHNYPEDLPNV